MVSIVTAQSARGILIWTPLGHHHAGQRETGKQEGYEEVLVLSHIRAGFRYKPSWQLLCHRLLYSSSHTCLLLTAAVHLVAQADSESWFACAHFPSAGVTGMPHQFWFYGVWELNLGLRAC